MHRATVTHRPTVTRATISRRSTVMRPTGKSFDVNRSVHYRRSEKLDDTQRAERAELNHERRQTLTALPMSFNRRRRTSVYHSPVQSILLRRGGKLPNQAKIVSSAKVETTSTQRKVAKINQSSDMAVLADIISPEELMTIGKEMDYYEFIMASAMENFFNVYFLILQKQRRAVAENEILETREGKVKKAKDRKLLREAISEKKAEVQKCNRKFEEIGKKIKSVLTSFEGFAEELNVFFLTRFGQPLNVTERKPIQVQKELPSKIIDEYYLSMSSDT